MNQHPLITSGVVATLIWIGSTSACDNNLVLNADGEIGVMDGWTPVDLVEIETTSVPGAAGLPGGYSIGESCFAGLTGPLSQSCSQIVDVSGLADDIDAGLATATVSGAIQSRTDGGFYDTMTVTYDFRDGGGSTLLASSHADESIVPSVADWHLYEQQLAVPVGTRTIEVTLDTLRTIGVSTDAYADNICLAIDVPTACTGDIDDEGTVGVGDLLALLAAWGPCPGCPEDLDGDDVVSVSDLLVLLGAWGACP